MNESRGATLSMTGLQLNFDHCVAPSDSLVELCDSASHDILVASDMYQFESL